MISCYLDWAAAAVPEPDLVAEYARIASEHFANPSAAHSKGREAFALVEESRRRFARAIGAQPAQVVFTSCGTESNNLALLHLIGRRSGRVVVSGIEHASVFEPGAYLKERGFEVSTLQAGSDGIIDAGLLRAALDAETALVALMLVNNETGALQPIEEVVSIAREAGRRQGRPIHVHCDCVQALGKVELDCTKLGIDSASFSGHKLGAPRGAGVLYLRRPLAMPLRGGGQEMGMRPGTENVAAIWTTALAAERLVAGIATAHERASSLRDQLMRDLARIPALRFVPESLTGAPHRYSPYITAFALPPVPSEVLVRAMSDRGFAISAGSACSTRGQKRHRVLGAMGVAPDIAASTVRISIGPSTTGADLGRFAEALAEQTVSFGRSLGLRTGSVVGG